MTALLSDQIKYEGRQNYKIEVFDERLEVSKGRYYLQSIQINVGQPKNLFVETDQRIEHILIFIFGTEKMAFYKVPAKGRLNIIPVDIPPLVEERIVYSAYSEYRSPIHPSTSGQYVILAGGVKHSGEASDAIDVYKISKDTLHINHIASGRLSAPAESLNISCHVLSYFGWYSIGAEKWALDFPTPEETVFKRLNDQDLVNREQQYRDYWAAWELERQRENERRRLQWEEVNRQALLEAKLKNQWDDKEWPVYTGPKELLPDACGMCLCEAEEIKQWTLPPCGHVSHAACVDCMRLYENRDQCHVCRQRALQE